jgi:hypothetical protein
LFLLLDHEKSRLRRPGERDPQKLARHKHSRIRASRQEIARSLEGTWRQELLFVLEQSLDLYQTHQKKSRYAINALMSN